MLGAHSTGATKTRALWAALAVGAMGLLAPARSQAHFTLDAPPAWMSQDATGSPQKKGPCGDEGGGTATNIVTSFQAGETITLKWTERVAHDGWYRIALSYNNRTDLTDPPYAINAAGNSTDAGIENPVMAPVLADGLFPHTAASITIPKAYSYDLKLPQMSCAKCTLQVIQIMLNHPNNGGNGYTYHHCADISIGPGDGGASAVLDAGSTDATLGGSSGAGSSGGSSSSGGSNGASSSGGSSGAGGSSGVGGSGGSSGVGSSGGSSGVSSSGGPSGSGGSSGTAAGSSGAATSSGGNSSSGASAEQPAASSGGCSFVVAAGGGISAVAGLAGVVAVAAARRRRRRG